MLAGVAAAALVGLERAQLVAVTLAARELAHVLNNDLALPVGALELLREDPALLPHLRQIVEEAGAGLASAAGHVRRLAAGRPHPDQGDAGRAGAGPGAVGRTLGTDRDDLTPSNTQLEPRSAEELKLECDREAAVDHEHRRRKREVERREWNVIHAGAPHAERSDATAAGFASCSRACDSRST